MTALSDWSASLASLEARGFFVLDDMLGDSACAELIQDFDERRRQGQFQDAGVGASADVQRKIRKSELIWLEPENPPMKARPFIDTMQDLKNLLNRNFYMGLNEWEAFYSVYRPGSFYRRHVDNFKGKNNRIITFILYLNQNWQRPKGGELRIYWDPRKANPSSGKNHPSAVPDSMQETLPSSGNDTMIWQECFLDIEPVAGRLVVFHAPEIEHEVLPCHADRYCITGWLRR